VLGGTNVIFLGIGGTKVDLVEGGKNVVVAVAKTSQRKNVGGKKVAALSTIQFSDLSQYVVNLAKLSKFL
jgi:hypothetical protein